MRGFGGLRMEVILPMMMTIIEVLILIVGFVCLIKGADIFVNGSSQLAKRFKVPGLIIGLTIVALGTSAPEMAVSTIAAIQGANEIALSNVVGSNIFNLLAVLGICAIIFPLPVDKTVLRRDFPVTIIVTIIVLFVSCGSVFLSGKFTEYSVEQDVGNVSRFLGIILILLFIIYIVVLIISARKNKEQETDEGTILPLWKSILFIVIGLALVILGGQAVVYSAKEIARALGMSETLIGLTIVAVGTSLPELVTSIMAARKGETGMAIGNVIGSNIFNLMFILGVSALINPVPVNMASVYDLIILAVISVITFLLALSSKKIDRFEGVIMVLLYIGSVVFAVVR